MRGLMGGFYRISEWIMRLSVTNVLWIVTSLPFFFFPLSWYLAVGSGQVSVEDYPLANVLLPMAVLAPFTFFPSTAAMFSLARKWVMGDGDVSLLKTYFVSYKENYKQSMIGGILFVVLIGVLFFNFYFYSGRADAFGYLTYLFIALLVLGLISVFNFFCIVVHLHMTTFQLFKNALLITVGQPVRSFLIGISNLVVIWVSFTQFTFLIPFFMGSIMAVVTFWHFYNGFRKIVLKQEQLQAKESEAEDGEASLEDEGERK
ncbi:DUF624 domain-containing protein [Paenibacillus sp. TRM 82003]|nr:DUF624 domain-containing protein [Paenibacillus sp. TRM 82003]